ncbi:hypothetical protein [uncultured Deinococcus sp.]|uniref:hypothetical protein n=1 Tax=uncultured Deinococcus sp. TaxID=158789 RepID=UPI0025866E2B|nr:hypothetical protein [uncultured Deinococcus sp.]
MPHTYRAALLFPVLSLMACGTAPTPQTQTAALQDASAQPASARLSAQATSSACEGGGFRLVSGDVSVQGNRGADLNVPAGARVQVLGKYVEFEVAGDTLSVLNYTMTGAANPQDITGGQRTVVFASKAADFGGRKLSGTLKASLSGEGLLLERRGSGIKMKIQAKDCAQGGIFQMEPETGSAVQFTHTLGAGMYYFKNPYTGKINLGNGTDFRGKDSPQVAKLVSQSETVSVWSVQSGGRMGGVLGEDAVEIGAGPTQCVQSCQAQNQIRGTLPVTDPAYSNN